MSEDEKAKLKKKIKDLKARLESIELLLGVRESPMDEAARAITFVQGILETQKKRAGHKVA